MWVRMARASASFPFNASHRGLSGMKKASTRNKAEGTAAAQNIHRHAICPFHDAAMSAAVLPPGIGSAMSQLVICAPSIPSTMVIWLSDTSLPRTFVGATSAMYMGDSPEATPMPMPPKKRATRKEWKSEKAPVATDERRNMSADTTSRRLRPMRSASVPHSMAPIMHPTNAMVMARPWADGESAMPK